MSTKEAFAKRIQRIMGERVPEYIPRESWKGHTYAHIFTDLAINFIDGMYPKFCSMKGELTDAEIKYHKGATHMNSSQIVCISYFKKFFEKPEYENYLLAVLRESGISIEQDEKIESAAFEYEPCVKEGTNFDFYLVLTGGKRISFEIKYTEAEFGGISPDKEDPGKYDRKWDEIYKEMVNRSPLLNVDRETFYKPHYQINRNIVYAKAEDYVVFLTPRANDAKALIDGRNYIDGMQNPHICNLYWEDVIGITQSTVKDCKELKDYYFKFYHKYIEILNQ